MGAVADWLFTIFATIQIGCKVFPALRIITDSVGSVLLFFWSADKLRRQPCNDKSMNKLNNAIHVQTPRVTAYSTRQRQSPRKALSGGLGAGSPYLLPFLLGHPKGPARANLVWFIRLLWAPVMIFDLSTILPHLEPTQKLPSAWNNDAEWWGFCTKRWRFLSGWFLCWSTKQRF